MLIGAGCDCILRQLTLHYKLTTDSKLYTLNSTLYSLHLGGPGWGLTPLPIHLRCCHRRLCQGQKVYPDSSEL